MQIKYIPCLEANHGGKRPTSNIDYIVVHYTAGLNDTAEDNGICFSRMDAQASAHYFVDENEIVRSVPDDVVAWHCGASHYYHPACRNSNSIGVEICSKYKDGEYYFDTVAVDNAAVLVYELMEKYQVPLQNVLRHYDVTRKMCPAPFVGEGSGLWTMFKERVMEVPDRIFDDVAPDAWYADDVEYCFKAGLLNGVGDGKFEPNRPVTRAEMAAILHRLAKK